MRKNHTAILILVLFACASLVCAIDTKRLKFGNDKLRQLGNIRSEVLTDEINAQISCDFCLATVWTFRELLELNVSMTELESFLTAACVKANIKSFDKKVVINFNLFKFKI